MERDRSLPQKGTNQTLKLLDLLGIQDTSRVWVGGLGKAAKRWVILQLKDVHRPAEGHIDVAILTPESSDEAEYFADKIKGRLSDHAIVWVVLNSQQPDPSAVDHQSLPVFVSALSAKGYQVEGTITLGENFTAHRFTPTRDRENV